MAYLHELKSAGAKPSPTDTPLPPAPTATLPSATEAGSPVPTQTNLPVAGIWTGGGTKLLISFNIQSGNDEATLSDIGILWEGHGECKLILPDSDVILPCERGIFVPCELNIHLNVIVPVNENGFKMDYETDDFSVSLLGTIASSTRIIGVLKLKVEGCGSHQVSWRAVPKAGTGSAP
jgi:hypothetical protein